MRQSIIIMTMNIIITMMRSMNAAVTDIITTMTMNIIITTMTMNTITTMMKSMVAVVTDIITTITTDTATTLTKSSTKWAWRPHIASAAASSSKL